MYTLVVAEKPSVARDIAAVLGAGSRRDGYLEGAGYRVTWAIGHLVGLAQPATMNPAWSRWSYGALPMLPERWPLTPRERVGPQLDVVVRLLNSRDTASVVCATDAGREGELIFRYVYEHALCQKPVERLWISSLTPEAIRRGFQSLEPSARFDALADAAKARSRADWLVGMNLSRAYSLRYDDHLSVGRVQTPTLALVVQRDLEIRDFVPETYHEVRARFSPAPGGELPYEGVCVQRGPAAGAAGAEGAHGAEGGRSQSKRSPENRRFDAESAELIAARARALIGEPGSGGHVRIVEVQRKKRRTPPPLLFDLTELQREANRLYGMSAKRTLEVAQELYEKHKLVTYPRTDSRHLSRDVASGLGAVVAHLQEAYAEPLRSLTPTTPSRLSRPLGKRFVDDARVTDHHAIIPTSKPSSLRAGTDLHKVYDLIARRLLAAYFPDHVEALTRVLTEVSTPGRADGQASVAEQGRIVDLYRSRGGSVEAVGWRALDVYTQRAKASRADLPSGLKVGQGVCVQSVEVQQKSTQPPSPHNEATLLTAMETAGKALDEKAMSEAMRERGLGTPATRAAILETLLDRAYLVREGKKSLRATPKGLALIERVHERVRSPALTGEWELRLARMQRGEDAFDGFMADIEGFVTEVVGAVKASGPPPARKGLATSGSRAASAGTSSAGSNSARDARPPSRAGATRAAAPDPSQTPLRWEATTRAPTPPGELSALLKRTFGFSAFRPHQEEICRAVAGGHDSLVVMPTGAGKSLCYQIPGLARGGTTLVISPLVALIEDQTQKLVAAGLRAERIHAGRGRELSREVCRAYVEGRLDYLFVAPERLGVRGFPELLAKRPPALIAIDEAHCISDWGHDFRPDYRMLRERLSVLPGVPIVALTATATPRVQDDIVEQLGLRARQADPKTFIFGFRRTNIAVEIAEVPVAARTKRTAKLLKGEGRLPAIVYAPTRKACEAQAKGLAKSARAAAYHAGMPAESRDAVQSAFQRGELDVVVATIAFGMGIDKANVRTVVHTALPATLEGYYQEIGRAGRDGGPSRAVLMHSFADMRTHQFFLERDYPQPSKLKSLFDALSSEPVALDTLAAQCRAKVDDVERWMSKLWVSGGACADESGGFTRGDARWTERYKVQRAHKEAQLEAVRSFVGSSRCRMLELVGHFGDRADSGTPCGLCDVCAPAATSVLELEPPTAEEVDVCMALVGRLVEWNGQAAGRLHRQLIGELDERPPEAPELSRRAFERLLDGLGRAGLVRFEEDSFEKGGEKIAFRRVLLVDKETSRADVEATLQLKTQANESAAPRRRRTGRGKRGRRVSSADSGPRRAPRARSSALAEINAPSGVVEALRVWRLQVSKEQRVPAYRVLTDRQLGEVAVSAPADKEALAAIPGVGVKKLARYAEGILQVLRDAGV